MVFKFKVGKKPDGLFLIDVKNKKILDVVVNDFDTLKINFPKIEIGYTYEDLEELMRFYMSKNEDLESIINEIANDGFFNAIKPSLRIFIEKVN